MHELHQYLAKYKHLEPPEASSKRILIEVVRDECGVELDASMVTVRNCTLFLTCHPAQKSEIRLAAPHIISALTDRGVRIAKIC